jgi:P-type E1-E2 ATPase
MAALASLEVYSGHPLGRALARACATRVPVIDPLIHAGLGISGTVAGGEIFIGSRRMAADACAFDTQAREWESQGRTVAFFGWGGQTRGALAFGDSIKPDAAGLCAALHARGIQTLLLSGDAETTTRYTAAAIGAGAYIAEALPARKIEIVRQLQQQGKVVAMIGDGVNDAPSLAQADLGIALGTGTDIAMRAAPLVLMTNSLHAVLEVFDLAHRTLRIVRQNLFWAFAYNALGITLAVAGVLNPILAAGAMVLSSLSVILNSRRLQ